MEGLQKGMSMNFMQVIAYRRGAKLLLMLGLFAVLSLAFITFGPDQVLADGKQRPSGVDTFERRLSEEQDTMLPEHPAGLVELADAELDNVQGAGSGLVVDREGPICMAIVVTTPDDCRGVPDPVMP
jgi:mersacidin/lichenicidin family type 2 lantibiotic